jgi:hypothetical protein
MASGTRASKKTQIYMMTNKVKEGKLVVDQRGFNIKRHIRNSVFVTYITAEVESSRCVTVRKLARAQGMLTKTIHATLCKDLNRQKCQKDGRPNF